MIPTVLWVENNPHCNSNNKTDFKFGGGSVFHRPHNKLSM